MSIYDKLTELPINIIDLTNMILSISVLDPDPDPYNCGFLGSKSCSKKHEENKFLNRINNTHLFAFLCA